MRFKLSILKIYINMYQNDLKVIYLPFLVQSSIFMSSWWNRANTNGIQLRAINLIQDTRHAILHQ